MKQLNQQRMAETGRDQEMESRIESFELAFRMQNEAPEIQEISDESEETLNMYGVNKPETKNFAIQCKLGD